MSIHGYGVEVHQPFLSTPFIPKESQQAEEPKWWTSEGIQRRVEEMLGHHDAAEGDDDDDMSSQGGSTPEDEDEDEGCDHNDQEDAEMGDDQEDEEELDSEDEEVSEDEFPKTRVGGRTDIARHMLDRHLHLTDQDIEEMGHFCHKLQQAVHQFTENRDKTKLKLLGFSSVTEARRAFSMLGRKGRLPWTSPFFKGSMPWIRSSAFILLPPAHMLLHGLCKTFLAFSFGWVKGWSTRTASDQRPLLLTRPALDAFRVRYSQGCGILSDVFPSCSQRV